MDVSTSKPAVARIPARILIADDEAAIREFVAQILSEVGYEVLQAGNGEEVLATTRERHPDLILLDLNMPGLDGIQTCQRLRADNATRNTPVLVVSGLDAKSALEESIIAGADDFLAKPIDAFELVVRVRSMLVTRNIHDEEKRVDAYLANIRAMREHGEH